ncbi:MAG TPA: hypothetical protein VF147_04955, partial [Vicinamibacterales bacterium]
MPRNPAGFGAALCAAVTACALLSPPAVLAEDTIECERTHVRATDMRAEAAIAFGMERSATFRALVDTITHSDLIVYISSKFEMQLPLDGEIHFITSVGSHRYMRIYVRGELSPWDRAAMVAHELQHATEVAAAPWVVTNETMDQLYHEIGFGVGVDRHETAAARDVTIKVTQELAATSESASRKPAARGASAPSRRDR